ncbi:MAG: hypothetical protein JWP87_3071 [Labilithrix sp.]|nr:hypothetical protein [Labilithrix sp.]
MRRSGFRRGTLAACALAANAVAACSSTPTATFTLTTGEETDALSRAPVPTTLIVEGLDSSGNAQELARTALPADELSLGDKGRSDVGALRVRAVDAAGKPLLKGESLYVQFGALEDSPLEVFIQRTGELARMPRGSAVLDAPKLGIAVARYVVAASGPSVMLYDLLRLEPVPEFPAFPRPARSLVTFGSAAIVIDEQGATTVDLSTSAASELAPPTGGTFAEIAGGATVTLPDGSAFVVGATRATGGPSQRVLAITKDGGVAFVTLATPREGACATWVEGRGLVVVGGSATGAGAELFVPGTPQGVPLPYPPDAVKSCSATTLDGSHVLVAGGVGSPADVAGAAPARVIDLGCASMCTPAVWPGTMPLVRAESFTLAPDAALVAGDDATGASRVFRVSAAESKEIPLKAPRRNARLVALPVKGTVAIVGGAAPIEQYVE